MDVLIAVYLKSIPRDYLIKGEEILSGRPFHFELTKTMDDVLCVSLPETKGSKKPINVLIENLGIRIVVRCTCNIFAHFSSCSHVAAAALYILKNKQEGPDGLQVKIQSKSKSKENYNIAFLLHLGIAKQGFKLKSVLLAEKNNEKQIKRFSGLPNLKTSLAKSIPDHVMYSIDLIEAGPKAYASSEVGETFDLEFLGAEKFPERYLRFLFREFSKIWQFLCTYPYVFSLRAPAVFKIENLAAVSFGSAKPEPEFFVFADGDALILQLRFRIGDALYDANPKLSENLIFIIANDQYFLLKDYEHVKLLQQYPNGFLAYPLESKIQIYTEVIVPLMKKYKVELDASLSMNFISPEPEPFVLVAEYLNAYLMMIPQFVYEDQMVAYGEDTCIVSNMNGETRFVTRDHEFEKGFYEQLRPLHPVFARQLQQPFFYVPFEDVMKGGWFLKTIRKLQDANVQVKGFEQLKRFRYSASKPKFQMAASSGIDWFELKIKFAFEDQAVPLKDIQNAVISGQKMVVLSNGHFGMLPEDWLVQFESVLKMGKVKGDKLIIDKKYFNLLVDIELHIKEEKMLEELNKKRKSLVDIGETPIAPLSKNIKAVLRPYQMAGFNWMQSLDHLGWGGCLADDMGLGKTLQAISFLQFLKEKYPQACSLVVCPTSLIYNWESELQKFAPELKYKIHYGINRVITTEDFNNTDVIITSYGSVRNDIDKLKAFSFHYIILDESQIIKNPEAITTKACQLLEARNRLVLSGTPVQNNTFDLYAQMHFLNPGFLGNRNFFKNQFAIPIDKEQDAETIRRLRKMTAPFILRRTKEKVANDLPDKSEIILWCHIKERQREVYDRYKQYYRAQLMTKIEEDGIKNSSFYILEGLTRLRQICDSPVLVKDARFVTTESAKLNELMREVSENTGNHKVLIFSQFTERLGLIREKFEMAGIKFLYLDGQTPGKTRMELVKDFQEKEDAKAFLISLKAGGVGLNLTAADYVYLVDPWWNPSAEAQAIDRTHRIGQTKKVFAYKMICKDSIEEKILQLQQKKKTLSDDLIGEASSFVGKLTKDDIAFLFE